MIRTGIPVTVLEREDDQTLLTILDLLTERGQD